MARRKKVFPCGHSGFGQFCHTCKQEEARREERQHKQDELKELGRRLHCNTVSMPEAVVVKAREVLAAIDGGATWQQLGGKLMNYDRHVASIPVTRSYRLLCEYNGHALMPRELLSHEDYNKKKPGS